MTSPHHDRLAALRAQLATLNLDGFVVPIADEHGSEYVGDYAQRLGWLSGFGGSAGTGVVLMDQAAMFTDGRYTLQVREQVDPTDWSFEPVPEVKIADWLATRVTAGQRIGFDPWLHTRGWAKDVGAALNAKGAELVPVEANPVDAVWTDRPAPSPAPLRIQEDSVAGRSSAEKRADVADWLKAKGADAAVLTTLESVAWTFNVRGADIDNTPVGLAYATLEADGTATLYADEAKVGDAVRQRLGNAVSLAPRSAFAERLGSRTGQLVAVDPDSASAAVFQALEEAGATPLALRDPTLIPRALKNDAEIAGHREAQARDGAAMARFLMWLEEEAPSGRLTELDVVARLAEFRRQAGATDASFSTISAFGAHGASPHYKVDEESNARIDTGNLLLVDSGGQYAGGTTDITRVIPVGEPTGEQRDRFTRVLKGMIALSRAVFPYGTTGGALDALARAPLWQVGLDYAHGTGHGVGAALSVHEGPARIAKITYPGGGPAEPIRAGMIFSNEPGYYKAGEYGIRIENLVLVEEREVPGAEAMMLGFETLTFAPIERRLIEPELLDAGERAWLDDYHADVLARIGPALDEGKRGWLEGKCAPIGEL